MIEIKTKGDFSRTYKFFDKVLKVLNRGRFDHYGELGVKALMDNTPKKTGLTASSWKYELDIGVGKSSITWSNTNVNNGVNIAVILQYGHGTGTGGYVAGVDYINPAMKDVFEKISESLWKEVKNA